MRRLLFHAAVRYPRENAAFQEAMDRQQEIVQQWWSEPTFAPLTVGSWETRHDIEKAIHETGIRELAADDALMLIVTGHGRLGAGDRHFLQLPGSSTTNQAGTAFPTVELVLAALASDAEHVVVVINCCHSGQLRAELATLAKDLPAARQRLATLAVFTTARHDDRPRASDYAELLARVHRQLVETAQIDRDQLTVEEFRAELVRASRAEPRILEPVLIWPGEYADTPSRCLPNPGYRPLPIAVDHSLAQVATSRPELDYWLDRASGRTGPDDPGWYFSGREPLTREITGFLADGDGVLVVTGAAATGKSALIARAVTLSDPSLRGEAKIREAMESAPPGTVPETGAIDAAVLARQKSVAVLAEDLIQAFGETPRLPEPGDSRVMVLRHQLEALVTSRGGATIVVDGLDEASDPSILLTDLIGPLLRLTVSGRRRVRMIIGVRSVGDAESDSVGLLGQLKRVVPEKTPRDPAFGVEIRQVRTDGPGTREDIVGYIERLLAGRLSEELGTNPYQDRPEQRASAARVIADLVAPSFLDARVAAERMRLGSSVQDLDAPAWLAMLGAGTFGLLVADIDDEARSDPERRGLQAALQAAAFAQGNGVPWAEVWPAMIEAVLDIEVPEADELIRRVLGGRLGGYLTRDAEDERIVYRPAHDLLSRSLRESAYGDRSMP